VKDLLKPIPGRGNCCSFKNAGKGVGRARMSDGRNEGADGGVSHLHQRGLHGAGLATVLLQIVAEATGLAGSESACMSRTRWWTPDSGTSTASRRRSSPARGRRAAVGLKQELDKHSLTELEGREFLCQSTIALLIHDLRKNPTGVSHVAYGYATPRCHSGSRRKNTEGGRCS